MSLNYTQVSDGNQWKINNIQNINSSTGNSIVISGSASSLNVSQTIDVTGNLFVSAYFLPPISNVATIAAAGSIRYNPSIPGLEYSSGSQWINFNIPFITLATLTILSLDLSNNYVLTYANSSNTLISSPVNGGFTIYTFKWNSATTPGTTITGSVSTNFTGSLTYLVVAGGGGGGGRAGGGGGAGGLLTGTTSVTSGAPYNVQVGAGGPANTSTPSIGNPSSPGVNSYFNALVAAGGGAGGGFGSAALAGGSGGGGSDGEEGITQAGGAGTPGQGFGGGSGLPGSNPYGYTGGGGGGAGAVGTNASGSNPSWTAGSGGPGLAPSNITAGPSIYYAGGGGGAIAYLANGTAGSGGLGGGGNGAYGGVGVPGTNGLGGGGGGGGFQTSYPSPWGGNGGSGVVILRFPSYF